MSIAALIVAGGKGKRMNTSLPKQFLTLHRKSILYYTLQTFQNIPEIDTICLVLPKGYIHHAITKKLTKQFNKIFKVIEGGEKRQDSVYNGLCALENSDTEIVLIQDAVRPFSPIEGIKNSIKEARRHGAAMLAIPATDTVKIINPKTNLITTPERKNVWLAQTPQTFQFKVILDAYRMIQEKGITITDDVQAVELCGKPVRIVIGSPENIKITIKNDLIIAKKYLHLLEKSK